MKVLTTRKVQVVRPENMKFEMDQYASIDGRNSIQVAHFQQWANKNKKEKLRPNGNWNKATRLAYSKYGRQWESVWKSMYPNYEITNPEGKTRAGYFWDSVKQTWVGARDSGMLSNVANVASQYGINIPKGAVDQMQPGSVDMAMPPVEEPTSEPEKGGMLKWALIITAVAVVGYVVVKKMSK